MLSTYKTKLLSKRQLTSDVWLFTFGLVEPIELLFSPGQYLILFVPQEDGTTLRRLYSIASLSSNTTSFELFIQIIPGGKASQYLLSLKESDLVMFQGPAGVFALKESPRTKVFLATGTGIAPMRSITSSNVKRLTSNISLFWGLKTYQDVYLLEELKQLQMQHSHFQFNICLSREQNLDMIPEPDRTYFFLGRITSMIHDERLMMKDSDYYLCGGREVVESLRLFLQEQHIPKEQIYFEKF